MTNEELDRAIAEHLGWQRYGDEADGGECWYKPHEGYRKTLPRYSTDLNAMHEAVASLTELELSRYADEVCDLAYNGHHDADIQKILKMGAKELAECYVMAIGKWEGK